MKAIHACEALSQSDVSLLCIKYVLHFHLQPATCDTLRMVQITMKHGCTPLTPYAFGAFGITNAEAGNVTEGCRFGMYHLDYC